MKTYALKSKSNLRDIVTSSSRDTFYVVRNVYSTITRRGTLTAAKQIETRGLNGYTDGGRRGRHLANVHGDRTADFGVRSPRRRTLGRRSRHQSVLRSICVFGFRFTHRRLSGAVRGAGHSFTASSECFAHVFRRGSRRRRTTRVNESSTRTRSVHEITTPPPLSSNAHARAWADGCAADSCATYTRAAGRKIKGRGAGEASRGSECIGERVRGS